MKTIYKWKIFLKCKNFLKFLKWKKKSFLCTKLQHGNQSLHSFDRNWAMFYCRECSAFLVFLINMVIMEEWVILCAYLACPPWGCERILKCMLPSACGGLTSEAPTTHLSTWLIPMTDSYNFGVSCLLFSLKSCVWVPWGNINMGHVYFLMFRVRLGVGCFSASSAINKIYDSGVFSTPQCIALPMGRVELGGLKDTWRYYSLCPLYIINSQLSIVGRSTSFIV